MLTYFTLFALLALGYSSPLSGHLKSLNETYNIQAVLVAGSNGYSNYRHQSDICHAYQVLRNHGVPEKNIIVFMYDDIASSKQNPYPGKIYNIPNGPDVYEGVPKDFTGNEVNIDNFFKVLKGDKDLAAKGKKVLTTGPNDHVFIYYADHGADGILGMPTGDYLTSKDLIAAFKSMNDNKQYGKMTVYVEACEAGSMFEKVLPENINIFATTASNPTESSWGTYCDVPGPLDGTCLGDEYSVAWLQDSDSQDIQKETLETQFENVVKNTPQSHPQEYGQKSLGSLDVGQFQGEQKPSKKTYRKPVPAYGSVNSRDIPIHYLRKKIISSNDANEVAELKKQYTTLISGRHFLKQAITNVVSDLCSAGYCSSVNHVFNTRRGLVDHDSFDRVVKQFRVSCLDSTHTDVFKYMYAFANLVEENQFTESTIPAFLQTLANTCTKYFENNQFKAIV